MRLAVDVKGTLEGPKKAQVLKIIELFAKAGYDITVWSNLYSYAVNAVRENNLKADADSKKTKYDFSIENDESKFFNFAIEDDRNQEYLAAKRFIWVDDIPNDLAAIDLYVKELLEGQ